MSVELRATFIIGWSGCARAFIDLKALSLVYTSHIVELGLYKAVLFQFSILWSANIAVIKSD